jgi:predicted nucleotidyltransferase
MKVGTSLQNRARRSELAEHVVALLQQAPHVSQVKPHGSLAGGRADRYSDIDLAVQIQGISDRAFALNLPTLLQPIGPCVVEGWGVGFLPDTYIRTFYFSDYPLFWHVDIGCLSDQHIDGSDIKNSYHWPQIFKMWIAVVRDVLRGVDRVDELTAHIARWADMSQAHGTPAQRLSHLLDLAAERARLRGAPYEAFYQRCDELRREYLATW